MTTTQNLLFTKSGRVQWRESDGLKGLIVCNDCALARRFANEAGVSVAEVGTVEGETLECHIAKSIEMGANGAWCVLEGDDGEMRWGSMTFD